MNNAGLRAVLEYVVVDENGVSSSHPVNSVADLSGFKIRVPPSPLWVSLFATSRRPFVAPKTLTLVRKPKNRHAGNSQAYPASVLNCSPDR